MYDVQVQITMEDVVQLLNERPDIKTLLSNVALRRMVSQATKAGQNGHTAAATVELTN